MTFNEMKSEWFNKVVFNFHKLPLRVKSNIYRCVSMNPNKGNLESLKLFVADLDYSLIRDPLLAHIDAILDKKFHPEFKYHFYMGHNSSSACKELFSLLEQAIEHNDHKIRWDVELK